MCCVCVYMGGWFAGRESVLSCKTVASGEAITVSPGNAGLIPSDGGQDATASGVASPLPLVKMTLSEFRSLMSPASS